MGVACKPYRTPPPGELFFGLYFEPPSLMSRFEKGNILSTPSHFIRQCRIIIQNFCPFVIFVRAVMLGAI